MLNFQKVTRDNVLSLARFVEGQPYRTCDYTIGAIFEWRAYFMSAYAIAGDMLIMCTNHPDPECCYAFPVGKGDLDAALSAIEADARERGIRLRYCSVPDEAAEQLRARYGERCEIEQDRDFADYLYEIDRLINFSGKKLHGQKNHYNRFVKTFPSARYHRVTQENLPVVQSFLRSYSKGAHKSLEIEREELVRANEMLDQALSLSQTAGYIEVDGQVIAMSVGEVVGDTLYVHVEKADLNYPGAYQAIVSWFAQDAKKEDTLYCNREDDSGEEGLRQSKLAYHPIALLNKNSIVIHL